MPKIKKTKATSPIYNSYCTFTITIEDPNKSVANIEVNISNTMGQPSAEPTNYILQYISENNDIRLFNNTSVYFSSNAIGYEYDMTFTMYDGNGNIIPSSSTNSVLIEQEMILA